MSEEGRISIATRPRIGISANRMAPVRNRRFYIGKALQYAEESMLKWVWRFGGLPVMISMVGGPSDRRELVEQLDGLVLSGGEDVSPTFYGEQPRRPEWAGDPDRDRYEIELLEGFLGVDKPVLGVCRGIQLVNVAMGGRLYQDLLEDGVVARTHRDPAVYDLLMHEIDIVRPSYLYELFGVERGQVNTIHHQAIRDLAGGLDVMATSDDGIIEAVIDPAYRYLVGIQWHPEWITPAQEAEGLLSPGLLMGDFVARAAEGRSAG